LKRHQQNFRLERHLRWHLLLDRGRGHHLHRRLRDLQEEEENHPAKKTLHKAGAKRAEPGDET
jgi:hypothetical protein